MTVHCTLTHACLQWGKCALGIADVWDERNGLLWAEPFEKVHRHIFWASTTWLLVKSTTSLCVQAYHAHEMVVMFQPSIGTFKFRVLIESLMTQT